MSRSSRRLPLLLGLLAGCVGPAGVLPRSSAVTAGTLRTAGGAKEPTAATPVDESSAHPVPTAPAQEEQPTWARVMEKLKVYGDFRLRHESSFELDDAPDRDRDRLRLRLGADYRVEDDVLVGARLVTGDPDDPNSPHATFGDGFDGIDFTLDRAYLTWSPGATQVTGGKFGHPFYHNEVYGELLWDADVQPEGGLVRHSVADAGPFEELDLALGAYVLQEQSLADEAALFVAEVAGGRRLGEKLRSRLALAYYHYPDPTPDGSTALLGDNAGNRTLDRDGDGSPDVFASDFGILDANLGLTVEGMTQPLDLSLEYLENTRAEDRAHGWAAGLAYGSRAKAGDWRVYYQWQVIEQDAVFSAFAQDDFLFATNHRSHIVGYNYQLTDKVGLHLWGLVSARDHTFDSPTADSDDDQWRVRLDLNVKF